MAILPGPHDHLPENQLSRAQAEISASVKIIVDTCLTNRGSHAFLIQHAYQHVADFISSNGLTYLDRDRIYAFIRSGFREQSDSSVAGNASRGSDGGANPRADEATPSSKNLRTRAKKSTR